MTEEFRQATVHANGILQHYYRAGKEGQPQLILLHGFTDNGMCWVRVAQALSDRYDIIMPDSRGHGFTEAPENGYSAMERAADVAGLIDRMGLDRPVLFGHSMGAETALVTAASWPALVRGVILEDPPWRAPVEESPENRAQAARGWQEQILANRSKSVEELVAEARNENPAWPEEELGPWAESKRQLNPRILNHFTLPRANWRELLPKVTCPILLITSDPDRGGIVDPRDAEAAQQINSNLQWVHVQGAGHCIHRERFNEAMQPVKAFLAQYT